MRYDFDKCTVSKEPFISWHHQTRNTDAENAMGGRFINSPCRTDLGRKAKTRIGPHPEQAEMTDVYAPTYMHT